MTLIESPAEVRSKIKVERWKRPTKPDSGRRPALGFVVDCITSILAGKNPRVVASNLSAPELQARSTQPTVLQS